MRTGSRGIATITVTIIFSCVVAVVITVFPLCVFFLHGCLDDEIEMYKNANIVTGCYVLIAEYLTL